VIFSGKNEHGAEQSAPFLRRWTREVGFFYSFNVEVTGSARLYRVASVWTAGLGNISQRLDEFIWR
jgi:hypothetical protein